VIYLLDMPMDNFSVGLSLIRQVPSPNHSSNPKNRGEQDVRALSK